MKLAINLTAVPNTVPILEPGEYDLTIDSVELKDAEGNQKVRYEFTYSVADGPSKGRKVFDNYPAEFLENLEHPVTVKFKHMLMSTGMTLSSDGIEMDDLKGKTVKAVVAHRTYKDATDGSMKTVANLKDFVYNVPAVA